MARNNVEVQIKAGEASQKKWEPSRLEPVAFRPEAIDFLFDAPMHPEGDRIGSLAVVTVMGPLEHHRGFWWDSYEAIAERFEEAIIDPEVRAIVLRIDSPGGDVSGLFETAKSMRALRVKANKPVYAYVDEGAYSAAYALACVADEIFLPPSGGVGSVGVIAALCDLTEMNEKMGVRVELITSGIQKADGHPDAPMTDGAIARVQDRVNGLADLFFELVSETRGVPTKTLASYQAGCFYGEDAVSAGLADAVMSFQDLIDGAMTLFDTPPEETVNSDDETAKAASKHKGEMMGLLAAQDAVKKARAAVDASRNDEDRIKARSLLAEAERLVLAAKKSEAKSESADEEAKDECKADAEEDESDEDEAEDEDAESAEASKDDSSDEEDKKDDEEDDDDEKDDGDDAAEESEVSIKYKKSAKVDDLVMLCKKITGKSQTFEIMGALHALKHSQDDYKKLSARVARMDRDSKKARIEKLVSKVEPGKREFAKKLGSMSLDMLKAYVESANTSAVTRNFEENPSAAAYPNAPAQLTDAERNIASKLGISLDDVAKQKTVNQSKSANGVSH